MARRRKGRVISWDAYNFSVEAGDIMVDAGGRAWRLYESRGRHKRDAGELSARQLKRPGEKARIVDGKLVWEEVGDVGKD